MDPFKQAVDRAHDVLRVLHYDRRGDHFVNVNRAGAEAIHTSTIATIVHAALGFPAAAQAAEPREITDAEIDGLLFTELGFGRKVGYFRRSEMREIVRTVIALANGRGA